MLYSLNLALNNDFRDINTRRENFKNVTKIQCRVVVKLVNNTASCRSTAHFDCKIILPLKKKININMAKIKEHSFLLLKLYRE